MWPRAAPARLRQSRSAILALFVGVSLLGLAGPAAMGREQPSVQAKQFPPGHFFRYRKAPVQEKEQVLARIDATLKKLNRERLGLIAKGAVIGGVGSETKVYDRLAILDESGLIIIARKVPNLYYRYQGPAPMNPNIYLVIKNARVNVLESYIRYAFVVEGDYLAYAHKFVTAILENLENAAPRQGLQPKNKPGHR